MLLNNLTKKFKHWLPLAKSKIEKGASQLENSINNYDPKEIIPSKLIERLNTKLNSLPVYESYYDTLTINVHDYIHQWIINKEQNRKNCLVIKGNCVDNLYNILTSIFSEKSSLSKETIELDYQIFSLENLKQNRRDRLNYLQEKILEIQQQSDKKIILIPDLSYYFSRTIEGLEVLEKLLKLLDEDENKFWIIGCNHWLWLFLVKIYHWDAYIENARDLPLLSQENLQDILLPVLDLVEFDWNDLRRFLVELPNQNEDDHKIISQLQAKYFENLANLSQGCLGTASQLCFYSLRYVKNEETELSNLKINNPQLPDFPSITQSDRYLLFCIGLHGHLNKSDLANILGDDQIYITSQIECLVNLNLIHFLDHQNIAINPLFYSKLTKDLKDNHFLVESD
ncbi:hypothetical protein [Cyanobacterium aponinum]|uniref:Uncharacterized protein n=1 Tax=Cyanobacterium aponinum (strain PCC 10605) TaxID=755178 RepID=K9Z711_CYAAP|nr:hypothetical protein [Cyanobacterium aponinum]AFZ54929.1 hypothetical protein Cyan10605_2863 [Cyanobacterium aponinum PCC 10605]